MCRKNNVDKVVGIENKKYLASNLITFRKNGKKKLGLPLLARLIFLGINVNVYLASEVNSKYSVGKNYDLSFH